MDEREEEEESIFTVPFVDIRPMRTRRPGSDQSSATHINVARWRHCGIRYFSCLIFNICQTSISNINIIHIITKCCSDVAYIWCGYCLTFSGNRSHMFSPFIEFLKSVDVS